MMWPARIPASQNQPPIGLRMIMWIARRESSVGGTVKHSRSRATRLKPSAIASAIAGGWDGIAARLGARGWEEERLAAKLVRIQAAAPLSAACAKRCMLKTGLCQR